MATLKSKEQTEITEYLSSEELVRLENAAKNFRDKVLIHILRRSGCRISEALGIRIIDVNFKERIVTIVHEKIKIKRYCPFCNAKGVKSKLSKNDHFCGACGNNVQNFIEESKDDKEYRTLPFDDETMGMLKDYISTLKIDKRVRLIDRTKIKLFKFTRQRAWQIITECAERANLPKIINIKRQTRHHVSPHRIRDAFATHAANKDSSMESLNKLKNFMGHSKIDTTMSYVKISSDEYQKWYNDVILDKN
jgi:integrase/recombinase XerD